LLLYPISAVTVDTGNYPCTSGCR